MGTNNGVDSVTATLTVNELDVRFQNDSAVDVNNICQKRVRKNQVSPTTVLLNDVEQD